MHSPVRAGRRPLQARSGRDGKLEQAPFAIGPLSPHPRPAVPWPGLAWARRCDRPLARGRGGSVFGAFGGEEGGEQVVVLRRRRIAGGRMTGCPESHPFSLPSSGRDRRSPTANSTRPGRASRTTSAPHGHSHSGARGRPQQCPALLSACYWKPRYAIARAETAARAWSRKIGRIGRFSRPGDTGRYADN